MGNFVFFLKLGFPRGLACLRALVPPLQLQRLLLRAQRGSIPPCQHEVGVDIRGQGATQGKAEFPIKIHTKKNICPLF